MVEDDEIDVLSFLSQTTGYKMLVTAPLYRVVLVYQIQQ